MFFLFHQATPLFRSRILEGLFELTQHPSRAPNLASFVPSGTSGIQGLGADVSGHSHKQPTQTLIVCFCVKSQENETELVTRPVVPAARKSMRMSTAAPPYMGVMGVMGAVGGAAPAMGTFGGAFNTNEDIFKTPFGGGPPRKLNAPSHRSDH